MANRLAYLALGLAVGMALPTLIFFQMASSVLQPAEKALETLERVPSFNEADLKIPVLPFEVKE
ncbi:MAG: hypothetical protein ACO23R_17155 [bacterium]